MDNLKYIAMPTELVRSIQEGGVDAQGVKAELHVSDGQGNPCRHCLKDIPLGENFLILSYRPFERVQPYAETGPIFLCAKKCERHDEHQSPEIFETRDSYLVRAYDEDDRIIYGSGRLAKAETLSITLSQLLSQFDASYVHLRSGNYNCYQCRVEGEGL